MIYQLKPPNMVGNFIFVIYHWLVIQLRTIYPQYLCKSALVSKRSQHMLDAQKNKIKQNKNRIKLSARNNFFCQTELSNASLLKV